MAPSPFATMLILIGTDDALLEGLAQLLAGSGSPVRVTRSIDEAEEVALASPPLLVVVERSMVSADQGERIGHLPLAPGGAIVLFRASGEPSPAIALPHAVTRQTLADLELPLERHRLAALAQYVRARARESGRMRTDTPPERRAP